MVIMVLLNEAFTWATPETMFLRSRRRTPVASLAISGPSGSPVIPGARDYRRQSGVGSRGDPLRLPTADGRLRLFLLAGDRLRLALAGAGVGVGGVATHRQAAAVAQAPIGAEIHEPLDVHRHLAAKVALDDVVAVDGLADLEHLGVSQLADPALGRDADLVGDLLGLSRADAVDVLERDHDALVGRDIDACDAGHVSVSMYMRPASGREAVL